MMNERDERQGLDWSPEQRARWLASKGAPPHFRLTTVNEVNRVAEACLTGERINILMRSLLDSVRDMLIVYGYLETTAKIQDAIPAVGQAGFDARRFERATTAAIERLESTEKFLKLLATQSQTPANTIDIAGEVSAVSFTLAFLRAQRDAKLDPPAK